LSGPATLLAIASGGALGAMARYGVSLAAFRVMGSNFPWGTLTVNAVGSFAMGGVIAWLAATEPHGSALRAFLTIGLLGAFTTFSTFSLDVVTLYRDRTLTIVVSYIVASLVLSIGGLLLGLAAGKVFS